MSLQHGVHQSKEPCRQATKLGVVTMSQYSNFLRWSHRKKSKCVRSGDQGGHRTEPPHVIQQPEYAISSQLHTGALKCAGAPSCWNQRLCIAAKVAIWFYCKIIKNPPHGWDRSSMTQVLLHLLTVRSNMGALDSSKILEFFEHIFDAIKAEKVSTHHENLLKALLLVSRILGADYRLRLCQLGESIMFALMQLWKTRPSETCSELMLEFVSFQLALHHPKSAASEEKGARAHSWSLWKNHLLSLFKIFVLEIDELCEKNKYSSSKETILKPIFVSVFVEISAQVFTDGVGILDITQLPSTHDGTQPNKKRRVEVCFRTFVDSLTLSKVIPWLQVISAYIIKYPESIPLEEAEHLLEILIEINLSCNQRKVSARSRYSSLILGKWPEDYIERIVPAVVQNNILIPEQHGFRPDLSTTHQLLRVVETIKSGFKNKKSTAPFHEHINPQTPNYQSESPIARYGHWKPPIRTRRRYPTGTEVTTLTQQQSEKLPPRNTEGVNHSHLTLNTDTKSCLPIGRAISHPEVPIGEGNYLSCKLQKIQHL
ncbi:serine-protein kinase ATM [Trichonephila clavipes]|nr:serine-protein kinase ATM [Trichonephila clavipes]